MPAEETGQGLEEAHRVVPKTPSLGGQRLLTGCNPEGRASWQGAVRKVMGRGYRPSQGWARRAGVGYSAPRQSAGVGEERSRDAKGPYSERGQTEDSRRSDGGGSTGRCVAGVRDARLP